SQATAEYRLDSEPVSGITPTAPANSDSIPVDLHPANEPSRGRLLQVLGVGFGLAVILGNTIGAGILKTPGKIALSLQSGWMFIAIWLAGGLYALLGALSICELGTMIPKSGGQYTFARRALGDYAGFVVGWSDWISTSGSTAFISLIIAEYSGVIFERLAGQTKPVAMVIVLFFAVLQWRGIRWGRGAQNISSLLKALAFAVLIISCFALGGRGLRLADSVNP